MGLLGELSISSGAMIAHRKAVSTIGNNIANMNTYGFKKSDTFMATLGGRSYDNNHDIAGVQTHNRTLVENPGTLVSSSNNTDISIEGNGFFVFNSKIDGSGETFYGRDGSLDKSLGPDVLSTEEIETGSYLVDKNGMYLMGWAADRDGNFSAPTGNIGPMRLDSELIEGGQQTTKADWRINLDAGSQPGDVANMAINAYTATGDRASYSVHWEKNNTDNEWSMTISEDLDGNGIAETVIGQHTLLFNSTGSLSSPQTITVTNNNGDLSFELDLSKSTQFSGESLQLSYSPNGRPSGILSNVSFDTDGTVIGSFSNGFEKPLFKVAMAHVPNPNSMEAVSGTLFKPTSLTGDLTIDVAKADGRGSIAPNTIELSNVNLEQEFALLITAQHAYNSAAKAFTTIDEMQKLISDKL